jgi:hypothetical protein
VEQGETAAAAVISPTSFSEVLAAESAGDSRRGGALLIPADPASQRTECVGGKQIATAARCMNHAAAC